MNVSMLRKATHLKVGGKWVLRCLDSTAGFEKAFEHSSHLNGLALVSLVSSVRVHVVG